MFTVLVLIYLAIGALCYLALGAVAVADASHFSLVDFFVLELICLVAWPLLVFNALREN